MTNKKSIVFVSNTDGAQFKFRANLMRAAKNNGYYVSSVASLNSPEGCYLEKLKNICDEVNSYQFLRGGVSGYIKTIFKLFEYFKKSNFQVIHVFGHEAALPIILINFLLFKNPKIFVTFTGLGRMFDENASFKYKLFAYLISSFYSLLSFKVSKFICLNTDDLKYVKKNISNSKKEVAIRGEGFLKPVVTEFVKQGENLKIFYGGRLMESKGVLELLAALKNISRADISMIFAGKIDVDIINHNLIVEMLAGEIPRVKYIDFVNNIYDYIRTSDVVILPTKYKEGMPMILIEALAFDKYIISSRAPGVNDIFCDGALGCQLNDVNPSEICKILESLEVDVVRSINGINKKIFENLYSADMINKNIISMYQS